MVVIVFRSKLTSAAGEDYAAMDAELSRRVRTYPGFIAVKSFQAEDGERLTIVWWKDRISLKEWQHDPRHLQAKSAGRQRWYEYYKMEVAEVFHESGFERAHSIEDMISAIVGEHA
ncbi:MAG TPA: antibiotic biosynthesis monooxygenase [Terriglobales bacterium]|nr:antibiotic biosynthesis monooxygenase [Terriglobales bacterium]